MVMIYSINGYWKDDQSEFDGYLVSDGDVEEDDDDIFYYVNGEHILIDAVAKGEDTEHEFVITSYEKQ